MGVVYRPRLGRNVALEFLPADISLDDPEFNRELVGLSNASSA